MADFPVQWLSLAILLTNIIQLIVTVYKNKRR